ncbi:unnamed protein product [Dovyalis caffra]|uniref:Gnk2-homologous domain-containing protein n=1 Tax=Dovyalis caffra TaxID=77055 RepID=A0AAV1S0E6_9ROSI|nr:unnamed protein product [Dovyalis caffra]
MDSPSKPFSLVSHDILVLLASLGLFLPSVRCGSDFTTLVYKKCSNHTYTGSTESHSQTLSSLFQELLPQSSNYKFFKSTAGDENIGISAFFQCRNDLSKDDCHKCVNTLPKRKKVVAIGFEELKNAAFAAMESAVVNDGGFYETNYENLHVMAQCQGDLGGCDCGECISTAVQIVEEKCGSSISSQVYMDKCFMSYTYYPDGIPAGNSHPEKESKSGKSNGKLVAIVLGGAAVLGVGFILLKLISRGKEEDI